MIYPKISSLLEKAGDRYTLCVLVGKRAKQLKTGAHKLTRCDSQNVVTIATNEVNENMITYVRTKSGIK
jgi:DNA-directed RNA polymerase subunit omega